MTGKKCFLCGRQMEKREGVLYELCTNPKCPRSKPLPTPAEKEHAEDKI